MHKYCGWIDLVGKREFWRGPDRQKGGMLMIGINEAIRYLTGVFFFHFFFQENNLEHSILREESH